MKKKKTKEKYIDDGHTVFDMSGLSGSKTGNEKDDSIGLNKKEKLAAIKAAFATFFPVLLLTLACFTVAMLIIYFWLKF